ncbi:hypothetical protein VTN77DRAFT_7674 [Rasamsonia byssochlamydoides]|uniref:uncharacterized protein n=1 Tax=Rasamsonia byssochlamydoides TaxID=89139 RepID=UPI003743D166
MRFFIRKVLAAESGLSNDFISDSVAPKSDRKQSRRSSCGWCDRADQLPALTLSTAASEASASKIYLERPH